MNRKTASKELMETFIRMVSKYNALEKHPVKYGTKHEFHHSERHMLDIFGDNPGMNITELAELLGVTKGAISQIVSKLEKKGAVRRYKEAGNGKEVRIELTAKGLEIYEHHKAKNDETISYLQGVLREHPDDKVEFLVEMFKSLESYLGSSKNRMQMHREDEE